MRNVLNILFATYFLLIAGGIGVSAHFCGGHLVGKGVMVEAPSCGHQSAAKACDADASKKSCCNDDFEFFKITDQFVGSVGAAMQAPQVLIVAAVVASLSSEWLHPATHFITIHDTGPPPLTAPQRIAMVQSYLL